VGVRAIGLGGAGVGVMILIITVPRDGPMALGSGAVLHGETIVAAAILVLIGVPGLLQALVHLIVAVIVELIAEFLGLGVDICAAVVTVLVVVDMALRGAAGGQRAVRSP
jgi:hypothetical protein